MTSQSKMPRNISTKPENTNGIGPVQVRPKSNDSQDLQVTCKQQDEWPKPMKVRAEAMQLCRNPNCAALATGKTDDAQLTLKNEPLAEAKITGLMQAETAKPTAREPAQKYKRASGEKATRTKEKRELPGAARLSVYKHHDNPVGNETNPQGTACTDIASHPRHSLTPSSSEHVSVMVLLCV